MKSNVESYQAMNMGPRNLLILFFSAVAVSLVILIILSSLVFKNLSLDFNTHLPETTPDIGRQFSTQTQSMNPDSKADSVSRATVNVPPENAEPVASNGTEAKKVDQGAINTGPVSDDSALENNAPLPLGDTVETEEAPLPVPALKPSAEKPASIKTSPATRSSRPATERKSEQMVPAYPADVPSNSGGNSGVEEPSGPPVPGQ
jgi:hypothetical protein